MPGRSEWGVVTLSLVSDIFFCLIQGTRWRVIQVWTPMPGRSEWAVVLLSSVCDIFATGYQCCGSELIYFGFGSTNFFSDSDSTEVENDL
jgi:hypothetical protein